MIQLLNAFSSLFVLVNSTKLNILTFFSFRNSQNKKKMNQLKQTERTSKLQRKVSASQKIIPRKKKLRRITSELQEWDAGEPKECQ